MIWSKGSSLPNEPGKSFDSAEISTDNLTQPNSYAAGKRNFFDAASGCVARESEFAYDEIRLPIRGHQNHLAGLPLLAHGRLREKLCRRNRFHAKTLGQGQLVNKEFAGWFCVDRDRGEELWAILVAARTAYTALPKSFHVAPKAKSPHTSRSS